MQITNPADYEPLEEYYLKYGSKVFCSAKMLHHHTFLIRRELIEAGAMAKVGSRLFFHKTRFWTEYQRIVADQMNGGQR